MHGPRIRLTAVPTNDHAAASECPTVVDCAGVHVHVPVNVDPTAVSVAAVAAGDVQPHQYDMPSGSRLPHQHNSCLSAHREHHRSRLGSCERQVPVFDRQRAAQFVHARVEHYAVDGNVCECCIELPDSADVTWPPRGWRYPRWW
eukprot:394193-Prymnesium_polylepis.1